MFFNKEDVYTGYSLEEFSNVKSVLKAQGIKYSFKIIEASHQLGNFGMNSKYDRQYIVSVKDKDVDDAKYWINSVLNHN